MTGLRARQTGRKHRVVGVEMVVSAPELFPPPNTRAIPPNMSRMMLKTTQPENSIITSAMKTKNRKMEKKAVTLGGRQLRRQRLAAEDAILIG